jgi:hypothetical protein
VSEIVPIGLPNLVSQGDLLARARAAQIGADVAGNDAIAHELQRLAERRSEQVQRSGKIESAGRQRRDRERGSGEHHEHERYDADPDGDDDEPHALDVTA